MTSSERWGVGDGGSMLDLQTNQYIYDSSSASIMKYHWQMQLNPSVVILSQ